MYWKTGEQKHQSRSLLDKNNSNKKAVDLGRRGEILATQNTGSELAESNPNIPQLGVGWRLKDSVQLARSVFIVNYPMSSSESM